MDSPVKNTLTSLPKGSDFSLRIPPMCQGNAMMEVEKCLQSTESCTKSQPLRPLPPCYSGMVRISCGSPALPLSTQEKVAFSVSWYIAFPKVFFRNSDCQNPLRAEMERRENRNRKNLSKGEEMVLRLQLRRDRKGSRIPVL